MESKRVLNIDIQELCEAMEDSSYEYEYFFDLETGDILLVSDYMDDEQTTPLKNRVEVFLDRYQRIPRAQSREGYGDMVDFVAAVQDAHLVELLEFLGVSLRLDGKVVVGQIGLYLEVLRQLAHHRHLQALVDPEILARPHRESDRLVA